MRGDPGEIERGKRSQQVAAIDGAQAIGEDEVIDDPRPQAIGHVEALCWSEANPLEAKQRVWRQNERPYLVQIGVGKAKGLDHRSNLRLFRLKIGRAHV